METNILKFEFVQLRIKYENNDYILYIEKLRSMNKRDIEQT